MVCERWVPTGQVAEMRMLFPPLWFSGSALLLRAVAHRCYPGEAGKIPVIAIKDKSGAALITELTLSLLINVLLVIPFLPVALLKSNLSPDLLEEPFPGGNQHPGPPPTSGALEALFPVGSGRPSDEPMLPAQGDSICSPQVPREGLNLPFDIQ